MARQLRVQFPGAIYHIVTRGDGRRPLFHDDGHYDRMTKGLKEEVTRSGWKILAFCWMPNHIHLLLQTPEPNLARGMQHWLSGYANWYAKRNQRVGHLFQGRYKAFLVEDAGYFWSLSRYIHLNPCSGTRPLAIIPDAWEHSSYGGYVRKTSRVDWIVYDELHQYWVAANGGKDPARAYRQYVSDGLELPENPLSQALSGWVLGSEAFLKKAITMAQSSDTQKRQRTTRRLKAVTCEEIMKETAAYYHVNEADYIGFRSAAAGRDIAALLCRRWTGEPLSKLSERFGLSHPDSASNLVRRAKKRETESKSYRKAIQEIEYNLDLKTENLACPPEPFALGFRSAAAGRDIAALLCRRWTGEPLSKLSERFGLSHPDSASNLVRRAKKRETESRSCRKAIQEIEYNLDLETENLACPPPPRSVP